MLSFTLVSKLTFNFWTMVIFSQWTQLKRLLETNQCYSTLIIYTK